MIRPSADGELRSDVLHRLAMSGPRVDGILEDGVRFRASLWGSGQLGTLRFPRLEAPWSVRPNLVTGPGFRFALARSRPLVVLERAAGTDGLRLDAARLPVKGFDPHAEVRSRRDDDGTEWREVPWGFLALRREGRLARLALGESAEEARAALALEPAAAFAEAEAYAAGCRRIVLDDDELGSMAVHSLHAALATLKRNADGSFGGVAAGPGYSRPARTYYRDAYWTLQACLPFEPAAVRGALEILTRGVHDDGECPSAVITPGPSAEHFLASQGIRKDIPVAAADHPHDWWRDHFDSPLYFGILLAEYEAHTDDPEPADAAWGRLEAIARRYAALPNAEGVLPRKPAGNDRDWADNVFRTGLVTYDLALYHGFLTSFAALARSGASGAANAPHPRDAGLADELERRAAAVRGAFDRRMWDEARGHFLEYRAEDGFVEGHLTGDSLTALRFGLAREERRARVLDAVDRLLVTVNNREQPYGDWGVMACFPPYARRADTRSKSAFPFRYHNGADWPYLDALYAGLLLQRGDARWRYPLVRWWTYGLEHDWPAPVEYFSPPYGAGAPLQGWSGMGAAALVQDAFGFRPPFAAGAPLARGHRAPFARGAVQGVRFRGETFDLVCEEGVVSARAG